MKIVVFFTDGKHMTFPVAKGTDPAAWMKNNIGGFSTEEDPAAHSWRPAWTVQRLEVRP